MPVWQVSQQTFLRRLACGVSSAATRATHPRSVKSKRARQTNFLSVTLRWAKAAKMAEIGACRAHPRRARCAQDECEPDPILPHPRSAKHKRARQKTNSYQ
jgi:hypothetical protein